MAPKSAHTRPRGAPYLNFLKRPRSARGPRASLLKGLPPPPPPTQGTISPEPQSYPGAFRGAEDNLIPDLPLFHRPERAGGEALEPNPPRPPDGKGLRRFARCAPLMAPPPRPHSASPRNPGDAPREGERPRAKGAPGPSTGPPPPCPGWPPTLGPPRGTTHPRGLKRAPSHLTKTPGEGPSEGGPPKRCSPAYF